MKLFLELVALIKGISAMVFSGLMVLSALAGPFFGCAALPFSFVWQALFVALAAGLLWFAAFSDVFLRRAGGILRLLLFLLPMSALTAGCAAAFRWLPLSAGAWPGLFAACLAVFGIIAAALEVYTRVTGRKYHRLLEEYRRRKG